MRESYTEYLKGEDWAKKRRQALKRDGYKCFLCQQKHHLHVHHMKYRKWYNVKPNDLVVLCEDCHKMVHDGRLKIFQSEINRLRYASGSIAPSKKHKGKSKKKPQKGATGRVCNLPAWLKRHAYEDDNGNLVVDAEVLLEYFGF